MRRLIARLHRRVFGAERARPAPAGRFWSGLDDTVESALYADYPTYRAMITILNRLSLVEDLQMNARLVAPKAAPVGAQETKHTLKARPYPAFHFTIDGGQLFILGVSCKDRIFVRFATRADLRHFLQAARPAGVLTGAQLSANPKGYPLYFEMMAAFRAGEIDYTRAANVLAEILTSSPVRRAAQNSDDTELEALLRAFSQPQDETVFDELLEQILDRIDETNFDAVLDSLKAFDPLGDDDPGQVAFTEFIIIEDLVRERHKLLAKSRPRLITMKAGLTGAEDGSAKLQSDIDYLISHIDQQAGP